MNRVLMQFADYAGPDQPGLIQGLHCLLAESVDTVVYLNEQRMLRSNCKDLHADLDLHCLQTVYKGLFSCVWLLVLFFFSSIFNSCNLRGPNIV